MVSRVKRCSDGPRRVDAGGLVPGSPAGHRLRGEPRARRRRAAAGRTPAALDAGASAPSMVLAPAEWGAPARHRLQAYSHIGAVDRGRPAPEPRCTCAVAWRNGKGSDGSAGAPHRTA